ncbi:alpha/beta fold hydrolase [Alkalicoccobacillus murimartini]|nr:alpha/beta fold hydrolase [Alkalicoccobacillus murimartini]
MNSKVIVSPLHAYVDEQTTIQISGCNPKDKVRIESSMLDQKGNVFKGCSTFQANEQGEVDLSKADTQADVAELFWAAEKENTRHGDYFFKSDASEVEIELQIKINDQFKETVQLKRYFYKEDIVREGIHEQGIVGTLFYSASELAQPAVLLIGGSDGEIQEHAAALLASKGYTVFTLAYFGQQEGVPKDLEKIPLEYFYDAVQWLKARANQEKISLIGYSRGAELALLLASTYDEFTSVVAGAPGAYITSGLKNGIYAPIPSWTLNQEELPFLKFKYRFAQMFAMVGGMVKKKPVSFLSIWENSLQSPEKIEDCRIRVENIKASVLLIAGGQDQIWPASQFATQVEEKMNDQNVHVLHYKEAGHFLGFPYALPGMPANVNEHVGGRLIMNCGGSKSANAAATNSSWNELLNYLRDYAK